MAKKIENEIAVAQPTVLTSVEQEERSFELMLKQASMIANSSIVPDAYKGEINTGNVIIAMDMAKRMNIPPLMVMQNLNIIYGRPSFSSAFLIAAVNKTGRYSTLHYEFRNDAQRGGLGCRCYAYEKEDKERKEPLCGSWVTMEMATKEGWVSKKGSKWQTMPEQMLRYRAATLWQRTFAPEVSMGLHSDDEVIDAFAPVEKPAKNTKQQDIEEAMKRSQVENSPLVVDIIPDEETTTAEEKTQQSENL